MKIFTKHLAILIVIAFTFAACGKYEDGPKFSLASKKSRLVNTWKIEKKYEKGIEEKLDAEDLLMSWEFKRDNTTMISVGPFSVKGKWAFENDKERVVIEIPNDDINSFKRKIFTILRLKSNELWLEEYPEKEEVIHFVSK